MGRLFDDMPDAKHVNLPPITRKVKVERDDWLGHFEKTIEVAKDKLMQQRGKGVDDAIQPQIDYYSHQISTIKWLRGINWQSREKKG